MATKIAYISIIFHGYRLPMAIYDLFGVCMWVTIIFHGYRNETKTSLQSRYAPPGFASQRPQKRCDTPHGFDGDDKTPLAKLVENHWIGLREILQENPVFSGKIYLN